MKKTKIFITAFIMVFGLSLALPALAQNNSNEAGSETGVKQLQNNLGSFGGSTGLGDKNDTDLKGKIANIINIVLAFLGIIAVIMIITAGYQWLTAGGNEDKVKEAKSRIKNAVIGIAIVLLSYIIVNYVVGAVTSSVQNSAPSGSPSQPGDFVDAPPFG